MGECGQMSKTRRLTYDFERVRRRGDDRNTPRLPFNHGHVLVLDAVTSRHRLKGPPPRAPSVCWRQSDSQPPAAAGRPTRHGGELIKRSFIAASTGRCPPIVPVAERPNPLLSSMLGKRQEKAKAMQLVMNFQRNCTQ